jgi:hypothetical protein
MIVVTRILRRAKVRALVSIERELADLAGIGG